MIQRLLSNRLTEFVGSGKAIIIMGARQVGKTTVLKSIFGDKDNVLWLNADEQDVRSVFENASSTRLTAVFRDKKIVVIDEAQRISDVGLKLKLITDQIPDIQLVVTGSSSFELANRTNEPLTGRKWEFQMFPLTFSELVSHNGLLEEKRMLPHRLVYGNYPEVVSKPAIEEDLLKMLSDSYLYKDIFTIESIHRPEKIVKILQALAYQIGSEVSYNELGQICSLDSKTVEKYISLLEQAYIIFRLPTYSKNLRNELKNSRKVFFWDLGIRNAVIGNFLPIEKRTDVGAMFENYMIAERIKINRYTQKNVTHWFWRTTARQEVDFLEVSAQKMSAFEFKWNPKKSKVSAPLSFQNAYPDVDFLTITPDNVEDFLLE
ncbi:MAG: ATP-binding protein [Bacteroidales bacterium]|nr:ATP-binding protein [Bacteroidales bacterium]